MRRLSQILLFFLSLQYFGLAVADLSGVIITETGPLPGDPKLLSVQPARAVLGGTIQVTGQNLGSDPGRYGLRFKFMRGVGREFPEDTRTALQGLSDTGFRLQLPDYLTEAGPYGLELFERDSGRYFSGTRLELVLPTPVIRSYQPVNPCPGDSLTLVGSGFSNIRNLFSIGIQTKPQTPGSSFHGEVSNYPIEQWTDTQIRFRLPSDSLLVKPGYLFQVELMTETPRGLRIHGAGPQAQLGRHCLSAPTAPGTPVRQNTGFGPGHRPFVNLTPGPFKTRVKVGETIGFTGAYTITGTLPRDFRSRPFYIQWHIDKMGGRSIAQGTFYLRQRKGLFHVTAPAPSEGRYQLHLNAVDWIFVSDLDALDKRIVEVYQPATGRLPEVRFTPAALTTPVPIGRAIAFGGTFMVTDRKLLGRLTRSPVYLAWEIRDARKRAVKKGRVRLQGSRTPLLVTHTPAAAGDYHLWLGFVPGQLRVSLRTPDLPSRAIRVQGANRSLRTPQVARPAGAGPMPAPGLPGR